MADIDVQELQRVINKILKAYRIRFECLERRKAVINGFVSKKGVQVAVAESGYPLFYVPYISPKDIAELERRQCAPADKPLVNPKRQIPNPNF